MGRKALDLKGKRFDYWTVIERAEDYITPKGKHLSQWLCECKCGTRKIVLGTNLTKGESKSCGCLRRENTSKANSKQNRYEFKDDYVIGYTNKDEPFYFDIEDFDLIKNYCWYINSDGYVIARIKGTQDHILMHRIIMGVADEKYDYVTNAVDHRDGKMTKNDNRKSNLRVATNQENMWNIGVYNNNKLGVKGVHKVGNKYQAKIQNEYLGLFDTIEEASQAYEAEAKERYGEFYNDRKQQI